MSRPLPISVGGGLFHLQKFTTMLGIHLFKAFIFLAILVAISLLAMALGGEFLPKISYFACRVFFAGLITKVYFKLFH